MNYRAWQVNTPDEKAVASLASAIGAPRLLARILVGRGLTDPQATLEFLQQDPPLSDPFLLKDMDKAVARIHQAVEQGEPIVIFGDYDVDGVTATALLFNHLRGMGADVRCKLPRREEDGYGLTLPIIEGLAQKGFKLLITVDNGISALPEAARAAQLGLDMVITDHHLPQDQLPQAVAVVDPARPDDESPFKALSGAGVAFKLCAALDGCAPEDLLDLCGDLAAIGTVADVMPLVGENRTLVRRGLTALQNSERPGLLALLEACGLADKPISAENISFALAPRLNAAGRMDSAVTALQLLLCEDFERGETLTQQLAAANTARQEAEAAITAAAEAQLAADPARMTDRVLVVWGQGYHPGVIGIVASRLLERYAKPVLVISLQNGEGKGSGRSVPGFNLHQALCACQELLLRYGGHALAAGLSIAEENLPAFRAAINEYATRTCPVWQAEPLQLDTSLTLDGLSVEDVRSLDYLAPYGGGNPTPLFLLENAVIDGIYPVSDGRHTRLRLRQGGSGFYAAYFGISPTQLAYSMGQRVDVALTLSVYEGKNGAQFSGRVRELRPAGLSPQLPAQAALFQALLGGALLTNAQKQQLLPTRQHIATLYRLIREGGISAQDLQPLLAQLGAEQTGQTLVGLKALEQLGLVKEEDQNGVKRYAPVEVEGKRDLFSAPILKALEV